MFQDFLSTYASLDKGTASTTGVVHRLCGRIFSRRDASNKLIFLDLVCESGVKVQVMVARDEYNLQTLPNLPAATTSETTATTLNYNDYFRQFHRVLHRGDLIGVEGIGYKTGMGEITISAKLIKLLAPSLHEIPAKLTDPVSQRAHCFFNSLKLQCHARRTVLYPFKCLHEETCFLSLT